VLVPWLQQRRTQAPGAADRALYGGIAIRAGPICWTGRVEDGPSRERPARAGPSRLRMESSRGRGEQRRHARAPSVDGLRRLDGARICPGRVGLAAGGRSLSSVGDVGALVERAGWPSAACAALVRRPSARAPPSLSCRAARWNDPGLPRAA
jgi:hypothetical protein